MTTSPTAAGVLLFVSAAAAAACPWYYRTSKGLLAIHFALVNFACSSNEWPRDAVSSCPLVCVSAVLLLAEALWTVGEAEKRLLHAWEAVAGALALFTLDITLVSLLLPLAPLELGLIMLFSLLLLTAASFAVPNLERSCKSLLQLNSSDMFVDPRQPLGSFGHGCIGVVHLAAIAIITAVQCGLLWLPAGGVCDSALYIIRSLGSLSMLFVPANFGGFIQAVKRTGRACGSRFAQPDKSKGEKTPLSDEDEENEDSPPRLVDQNGELSLAQ